MTATVDSLSVRFARMTRKHRTATHAAVFGLCACLLIAGFLFKVFVAATDTPFLYLGVYAFRKRFKLKINEEINLV